MVNLIFVLPQIIMIAKKKPSTVEDGPVLWVEFNFDKIYYSG